MFHQHFHGSGAFHSSPLTNIFNHDSQLYNFPGFSIAFFFVFLRRLYTLLHQFVFDFPSFSMISMMWNMFHHISWDGAVVITFYHHLQCIMIFNISIMVITCSAFFMAFVNLHLFHHMPWFSIVSEIPFMTFIISIISMIFHDLQMPGGLHPPRNLTLNHTSSCFIIFDRYSRFVRDIFCHVVSFLIKFNHVSSFFAFFATF